MTAPNGVSHWTSDWRRIVPTEQRTEALRAILSWPNPFLPPLPDPRPRQYPAPYPMAPTTAAMWAIVSARIAEFWKLPPDLDPLAPVRRELQAWLDGPTCPQRSESPWVGLMGAENPL